MLLSSLFDRTRRKVVFPALALGFAALTASAAAPAAHAQANLSFSGGNGTSLTLTLANPITYTAGTAPFGFSGFGIQNVGNLFNFSSSAPLSSTLTYRINGGGPQTITYIGSGFATGSLSDNDVFFGGSGFIVNAGDIVTLTSGSITGNRIFTGPPPAPGSFTTFLIDGSLSRVSTNGVAVTGTAAPEPNSLALLGLGLSALPLVGPLLRRRHPR